MHGINGQALARANHRVFFRVQYAYCLGVTISTRHSLSGDGHARAIHQTLLHEHLEHRGDAAHTLQVFHDVLAAGLKVGHKGHLVGNLKQKRREKIAYIQRCMQEEGSAAVPMFVHSARISS